MVVARLTAVALAFVLGASQAAAQDWSTQVKEDVFSGRPTAVMIGGFFKTMSLYISCDGDKKVSLSFISKWDGEDLVASVPASGVVKVDQNEAMKFSVRSYSHNENYLGFKTEGGDERVKQIVRQIAAAKKKVLAGLDFIVIDKKHSEQYSASGTKAAATKFMQTCGFE